MPGTWRTASFRLPMMQSQYAVKLGRIKSGWASFLGNGGCSESVRDTER